MHTNIQIYTVTQTLQVHPDSHRQRHTHTHAHTRTHTHEHPATEKHSRTDTHRCTQYRPGPLNPRLFAAGTPFHCLPLEGVSPTPQEAAPDLSLRRVVSLGSPKLHPGHCHMLLHVITTSKPISLLHHTMSLSGASTVPHQPPAQLSAGAQHHEHTNELQRSHIPLLQPAQS